jgi:hypothetical protein
MAERHEWLRTTLSRRALLRGGLVGAGGALAGSTLLGGAGCTTGGPMWWSPGAATGAQARLAAPFGRHLAYGARPDQEVTVSWQVPVAVRNPFVRVGPSPRELGERIPAEARVLWTPAWGARPAVLQHYLHVPLAGLGPGTAYAYAVGHEGYDPPVPDRVDSFRTAPPRGGPAAPFTFTAFGDQGTGAHAAALNAIVSAQRPAFHLHAGDIAYADDTGTGGLADLYRPLQWDRFFTQNEAVAATVPWMVAFGNHDMEALYSPDGYGGDLHRFTFPDDGPPACPATYAFVYGNVAIVSLDANDVSHEIPANLGYSGGTQTSWLEQRLRSLRADPDVDFIVVVFHHCAYSTCTSHASEGGVRQRWAPLFDTYGVDLVINGHNHVFERTDPIRGGRPTRPAPTGATVEPEHDGTTYVTVGTAGHDLYAFPVADSYLGHDRDLDAISTYVVGEGGTCQGEVVTWSRRRFTGYCALAVDAVPAAPGRHSTLTLRVVAPGGALLDTLTLARTAGGARPPR